MTDEKRGTCTETLGIGSSVLARSEYTLDGYCVSVFSMETEYGLLVVSMDRVV